jgi:hypothetical protein
MVWAGGGSATSLRLTFFPTSPKRKRGVLPPRLRLGLVIEVT